MKIKTGVFELPRLRTEGGELIERIRIGYETYGELSPSGDNAILIEHYLLGNCRAAGKLAETDPTSGYWDSVIGPGKLFDTDRYFIVCPNTLCNVNARDPGTVTTGPASLNPATGKPYGMSFPQVTMGDNVRVQKALLDQLGVRRLHAVAGASLGAMLSMAWTTLYPEFVERAIAVVPSDLSAGPYLTGVASIWMDPIRIDPHWNGGDYYGREEPVQGLTLSIKNIMYWAHHPFWAEANFGNNRPNIEEFANQLTRAFVPRYDANSFLYLVRAIQLFSIEQDIEKIRARILLVPSRHDLVHPAVYADRAATRLKALGKDVQLFELNGNAGHFDGIASVSQAASAITALLQEESVDIASPRPRVE